MLHETFVALSAVASIGLVSSTMALAAPGSHKAPAVADKMLGMVATAPDKLAGLRDQALLLIRFGV